MSPVTFLITSGFIFFVLYGLWQLLNIQKASKSRQKRKRRSDRIKLTSQQKKVYLEAQRLYQAGKYRKCAKLLETLNMTREAISILEKGKYIHEAASILLRIHRPNRAGIIYSRHGYWKDAAECFKKANMPFEVAKCLRESGDVASAVAYFIEGQSLAEAAECYIELGRHRDAAKLLAQTGDHDGALEQYQIMMDKNPNFDSITLNQDEVKIIISYLSQGMGDLRLADIQAVKDHVVEVIISLIRLNQFERAQKLYERTSSDIGPQLIAQEDLNDNQTQAIGLIFYNGGNYEYAGMVFERLGDFTKAGESFEKAEDFERAAYCFERAKMNQKATDMRIKLASSGPKSSSKEPKAQPRKEEKHNKQNPFEMGETTVNDSYINATAMVNNLPKPVSANAESSIPDAEAAFLNLGQEATGKVSVPDGPADSPHVNRDDGDDYLWQNFWNADFLSELTTEQKELFRGVGQRRSYPRGSLILDYDQDPAGIYFILAGMVQAYKRQEGNENMLDLIHPPETFGEFWLLFDQTSRVRFEAALDTEILTISRPDFLDILDKNGTVARKLYKRFTQRLVDKLLKGEDHGFNLQAS
jgi:tetratricopeptide (TPR) repeat protein